MKSSYKRLGDYIRQVDERNKTLNLGESDLYGISVYKEYITTHANLVGVKFDNYKVVRPNQFTYIPDTSRRGDKIAVALNTFGKPIIVSNVYTTFEIIKPEELNPEYLMLLFSNPEFDRYARFNSWGSAREIFAWEDFCNTKLNIPDIKEQEKIVKKSKIIESFIRNKQLIVEKYEQLLNIYFSSMFSSLEENRGFRKLEEYISFDNGYAFKSEDYLEEGEYKIITIGNVYDGYIDTENVNYLNNLNSNTLDKYLLNKGDIVISLTGNVGRTAIITEEKLLLNQRVARIVANNREWKSFVYCLFRDANTKRYLENISKGTAQLNLSTTDILNTLVDYDEEAIINFSKKADKIILCINENNRIIKSLKNIKKLLSNIE